ncbi:hypothetical protein [Glycomyces sp. NPDC047010]|uniref:hypothetical protein n=1 Tax=Glycomyces sp. NPDC047010 TaxID=3155023 RepID=UPI0033E9265E
MADTDPRPAPLLQMVTAEAEGFCDPETGACVLPDTTGARTGDDATEANDHAATPRP